MTKIKYMKQNKIENKSVQRKEYSYQVGSITLKFTLRTDNTDELIPFRELVKIALNYLDKDINLLISSRKKK